MMENNFKPSRELLNHFSSKTIGAAIKVHTELGPGLLEKTYEACLIHELEKTGLKVESQVAFPIKYGDVDIDIGYRVDLIVQDCILVELKSVEKINVLHRAQLLTYLKLTSLELGLLVNFNVLRLVDGIKRFVQS